MGEIFYCCAVVYGFRSNGLYMIVGSGVAIVSAAACERFCMFDITAASGKGLYVASFTPELCENKSYLPFS